MDSASEVAGRAPEEAVLGGEDLALGVDYREPPGDRPPLRVAGLLAGQTDDNLTEREAREIAEILFPSVETAAKAAT